MCYNGYYCKLTKVSMNKYLEDFNHESIISAIGKLAFRDISTNYKTILVFGLFMPAIVYSCIIIFTTIAGEFILAWFIFTVSWFLWIILLAWQSTALSIYKKYSHFIGVNDNKKSIDMTVNVIKEAKKWVAFHDYGENDDENIYSNSAIKDLLIKKLNSKKEFEVSMIFTKTRGEIDKLPLVKELENWKDANPKSSSKVIIKPISSELIDKDDIHYKINDTGHAFLTKHAPEEKQREFEYFTPYALKPIKKVNKCLEFHDRTIAANQSCKS